MAKGEITISEEHCRGCGYCVEFCPQNCIEIEPDKFNVHGTRFAVFAHSEGCTACSICAWMCPGFAIEVFKYKEKTPQAAGR